MDDRTPSFDHQVHIFGDPDTPATQKVAVIIISSRRHTNPGWLEVCLDTLRHQDCVVYVMANDDKRHTIGACWNRGVQLAHAQPFVTFIGDDDFVAPEFIAFLAQFYANARVGYPDIVAVTCYLSVVDQHGKAIPKGIMQTGFTGFFNWQALIDFPFDESLHSHVDTEQMNRIEAHEKAVVVTCPYYYGYCYRVHPGQVSGMKTPAGLPISRGQRRAQKKSKRRGKKR